MIALDRCEARLTSMKPARPRAPDRRRVEQLLLQAGPYRGIEDRIDALSRRLLGRAYKSDPLIGSADTPEVFTASLDAFDCVTYLETVLALARSATPADFVKWLRRIRYEQGRIEWKRRNHYMTFWIRNNQRQGILRTLSMPAVRTVETARTLNILSDLPARRIRLRSLPKHALRRPPCPLHTGDLIFFVSTRKHLDVFHAGIVVRQGGRLMMRHASRSRGRVVEQPLGEFLRENRMAGVIVARPLGAVRAPRRQSRSTRAQTAKPVAGRSRT